MTTVESDAQEVDDSGSKMDYLIRWRREKAWELRSMGCTIDQICNIIKAGNSEVRISHGTVCRDIETKEEEIRQAFNSYIEHELLTQHSLAITALDRIMRESWRIYAGATDERTKLNALALAKSAIMDKQQLLGDPAMIERAIQIVAQLKKSLDGMQNDSGEAGK